MKYIKNINENSGKTINMTKVTFFGGQRNVIALYIDNELHMSGDWYHHSIETKIHGFVEGVKWCGNNVIYKRLDVHNPLIGNSQDPPKLLSDIK